MGPNDFKNIIAHILGALGILIGLFIYVSKNRKTIVLSKFISDVVWMLNYLLLGAYTGAVLNAVAMGREAVFYNRGKKRWASCVSWLPIFLIISLVTPISEFIGGAFTPVSILPAVGSAVAVLSLYSIDTLRMRYLGILAYSFWLIYNIILANPTAAISTVMVLISCVIGIIRERIIRHGQGEEHSSVA